MHLELAPGVRIADRYELVKLVGEGGMGSVWNARHLALEAPVAIKFVRMQGAEPERFYARFQREAKLAASVRHRNVVSITDYGTLPDGSAFMVMDYLEGEPLSHYLRGPQPVAEIVYLLELTTRGLVAVHDAGIVHRDLKPENIFLVRDASGVYPKLIDFGISKQMRPDADGDRRSAVTTTDGAIVGTPAYMSPEQARGLLDLDQRTDIYSIGVILYEALSGRMPYDSPYMGDLILAIVMGGAPRLHDLRPDLDRRLCDIVMKAMASDPLARFQDVRELLAALSSVAPLGVNTLRSDRPPSQVHAPPAKLLTGEIHLGESDPVTATTLVTGGSLPPLPRHSVLRPTAIAAGLVVLLLLGMWLGIRRSTDSSIPIATPLKRPAAASTDLDVKPQPSVEPIAPPAPVPAPVEPEHAATQQAAKPAPQPDPIAKPPVETPRADPKPRVTRPSRERPKRVITELDY